MAFDFKKEYKQFYLPPKKPVLTDIPPMNYIAVQGRGDPNEPDSAYKAAIGLLYGIAFTIKMSPKSGHQIDGYFPYVVPPLEGLWKQDGGAFDPAHKDSFQWISMIRLPDFITRETFDWAVYTASEKKHADYSKVKFFSYQEGRCVQCMHIGSYDTEPATIERMHAFAAAQGCRTDLSDTRMHHEIYLSDPRRTAAEKLRTVIRLPVCPVLAGE